MRFANYDSYIGARPLQEYFQPVNDVGTSVGLGPPILSMPMGTILRGYDPYWGANEFMYVRANGAIRAFGLCTVLPTFNVGDGRWRYEATEVPNTANLGRTLGIALYAMAAGQYGWMIVGGTTLCNSTASVAADTTFGIAAAGQGGANTAGKQVLNARVVAPATTTVIKGATLTGGSPILRVTQANNIDGWYVGAAISGVGIPAATTIQTMDPDARTVTLSANATIGGGIQATVTYNDAVTFFNVVHLNRPFAQGAIT